MGTHAAMHADMRVPGWHDRGRQRLTIDVRLSGEVPRMSSSESISSTFSQVPEVSAMVGRTVFSRVMEPAPWRPLRYERRPSSSSRVLFVAALAESSSAPVVRVRANISEARCDPILA